MARYLTPSKVCLLTLISMYCDLPPSTASISLLSFLTSHIMSNTISASQSATLKSASTLLMTLDDISNALRSIPMKGVPLNYWEQFICRSWTLGNIDEFMDFFGNLAILFHHRVGKKQITDEQWTGMGKGGKRHQICLTKTSILGIFVRRAQVEFERLPFDGVAALWREYESYIAPTRAVLKPALRKSIAKTRDGVDTLNEGSRGRILEVLNLASNEPSEGVETPSTNDVNRLLEFQIDEMQSNQFRMTITLLRLNTV